MRELSRQEQYALAVLDAIQSLFRDEESDGNPNYHFDLEQIDGTEFFVGMIMGFNLVHAKFTGDHKDLLEFTHLCNTLAVQYLLENAKIVDPKTPPRPSNDNL